MSFSFAIFGALTKNKGTINKTENNVGCFNHKCNFSQLPAVYGDRIVVLVGVKPTKDTLDSDGFAPGNSFTPISIPIRGTYNDYGSIENVDRTPGVEALERYFGMDIEKIVDCAERITCGCENQIEEEYNVINKVLEKEYVSSYYKEWGLEFSYIMEHEEIFDNLIAMSNFRLKDAYYWRIPHQFLKELGYEPNVIGNENGYDVIEWSHKTLSCLKEECHVWKTEDFKDYSKVYNSLAEFCEYIDCEVPKKYNKFYFETMFLRDLERMKDRKCNTFDTGEDYSFMRYPNRGLFTRGEHYGIPSFLLSSLGSKDDKHMDKKYMKEVIEVALLYRSLDILQMTWNNTSYYRQDVDYDDHIAFLKSCLSVAENKKAEHEEVEED